MASLLLSMAAMFIALSMSAHARDLGQWEQSDPATRQWFQSLMQPDTIGMGGGIPCCGEGDGYWADEVRVEGDKVFAIITDDRPDEPLRRFHVPIGTEFIVPAKKMLDGKIARGNPTGHGVIFLGVMYNAEPRSRPVLCFILGSGT